MLRLYVAYALSQSLGFGGVGELHPLHVTLIAWGLGQGLRVGGLRQHYPLHVAHC